MHYALVDELRLIKRLALKDRALDALLADAMASDAPEAWALAEEAAAAADDLKAHLAALRG